MLLTGIIIIALEKCIHQGDLAFPQARPEYQGLPVCTILYMTGHTDMAD